MSSHKLLNTIDYIHALTVCSVPVVRYKQADAVVIVLSRLEKKALANSVDPDETPHDAALIVEAPTHADELSRLIVEAPTHADELSRLIVEAPTHADESISDLARDVCADTRAAYRTPP
ncbi:hypothetical protein DPMN_016524 [Dreissena polymorpha]|uniref:Uncharacterized protein n=1 Tax=Dreissena polymorpha TaxID=45954 RepID=A0A9D4NFT0_DREPO|nr:hypothetical protein DPMN_016524 [Dreissena polymorpha]